MRHRRPAQLRVLWIRDVKANASSVGECSARAGIAEIPLRRLVGNMLVIRIAANAPYSAT
jgi:hypothetical protein